MPMMIVALLASLGDAESDARHRAWALLEQISAARAQHASDDRFVALYEESLRTHDFHTPSAYLGAARAYVGAGRMDDAFAMLDRLLASGWIDATDLEDARLQKLATDSRWAALRERVQRARDQALASLDPAASGLVPDPAWATLVAWAAEESVSAAEVEQRLTRWHAYPKPTRAGVFVRFVNHTEQGLDAPYYVRLPAGYDPEQPTAMLVYSPGGWFGRDRIAAPESGEFRFDNPPLTYLDAHHMLELFTSANVKLQTQQLEGMRNVVQQIAAAKRLLNVDDDRVFLMGHSDGATGTMRMAAFAPTPFAAFYPICPMLNENTPYGNLRNRAVSSLSAEKDDLFDMPAIRSIARAARQHGADWLYREAAGEHHYWRPFLDDHLPSLFEHMANMARKPLRNEIHWECPPGVAPSECDWLRIDAVDPAREATKAHAPYDYEVDSAPKHRVQKGADWGYVDATFASNTFALSTSKVARVTLLLHPEMVDFAQPIAVVVNGEELFWDEVALDKAFMVTSFLRDADRRLVWGNRITVEIP